MLDRHTLISIGTIAYLPKTSPNDLVKSNSFWSSYLELPYGNYGIELQGLVN